MVDLCHVGLQSAWSGVDLLPIVGGARTVDIKPSQNFRDGFVDSEHNLEKREESAQGAIRNRKEMALRYLDVSSWVLAACIDVLARTCSNASEERKDVQMVTACLVLTTVISLRIESRTRVSISLIFSMACSSVSPYRNRSTSEAGQNF